MNNSFKPIGRRGEDSMPPNALKITAIPAPLVIDEKHSITWAYNESLSADKLKNICIKHPANTRATEDLNERNLADIRGLDVAQREVCYAQLVDGKLLVLEGWRRTNKAIQQGCGLTFLVTTDDHPYEVFHKAVKELSTKRPHSARDLGIFYRDYMETHAVDYEKCALVHDVSESSVRRYVTLASLSGLWLEVFDDFSELTHRNCRPLRNVEKLFEKNSKETSSFYKKDKSEQQEITENAVKNGLSEFIEMIADDETFGNMTFDEKLKFINESFFPIQKVKKQKERLLDLDEGQYVEKETKGDVLTLKFNKCPADLLDQINLLISNYKN
ncbi:hypothetical protein [Photobacterium sp. GB-72]|uniref:hypothetical protein n=1 Tax=Photobacterium sp. GB-72 TaxID=2022105 RepID=UPI000D157353|nr:hypothetical protein [Photobacterium sp. GB-72]PSV28045.1 hypothetical protein C9J40_19390 [Photobacterium sp. GB-72]